MVQVPRIITRGQGFGAEMSKPSLALRLGKSNLSKRNQTTILDIDKRELLKNKQTES